MFFQRMIIDRDGFLNYDYMGYTEYEMGATSNGRYALAEAFMSNDLVQKKVDIIECYGRSRSAPTPMIVIGRKVTIANMKDQLLVPVDKSSMRLDNSKIVGWLHVFGAGRPWKDVEKGAFPFLIIRPDLVRTHPLALPVYLDKFVQEIKEDRGEDFREELRTLLGDNAKGHQKRSSFSKKIAELLDAYDF